MDAPRFDPDRLHADSGGRRPARHDRWDDAVVPPRAVSGSTGTPPAGGLTPQTGAGDTGVGGGLVGGRGAGVPGSGGGGPGRGDAGRGDGSGPPHGRSGGGGSGGRRRRGRRARIVLACVLVLALAACASAGALMWYGGSNIDQTAIEGISQSKGRTVTLRDGDEIEIMNVLLVGVDNPGSLSEEQRARVAPDERSGRRPDVLMLAQLEVGGSGAALLSFPRDLRVELCDGRVDKINASFAAGERLGMEPESCLVQTVSGFTGVDIDHYVEVDFGGFLRVVEALGGVTMYLEDPMIDRKAHLDVPAGCVRLTPEQALGFVRSRGYDDDFGRMARQQRFLKEAIEEARRVGVVANPARLFALVDRASDAVRTDDELGLAEMRDLAFGLRNLTSSQLVTHTIPSRPTDIDGISYVVADEAAAERLYASFRDGSVLRSLPDGEAGPPVAGATESPPAPSELPPVVVLNAAGVAGLASRTAELLEANGIRIADVGNAESAVEATEILHGTGLSEHARTLAETLGQGSVRLEAGGAPLRLVLGADYDIEAVEAQLADAVTASVQNDPTPTAEPTTTPTGPPSPTAGPTPTGRPEATAGSTPAATPPPTGEPSPTFRDAQRPEGVDC